MLPQLISRTPQCFCIFFSRCDCQCSVGAAVVGGGGAVTALTCFGPTQDLSQLSPGNSLNITIIITIII